VQNGRRLFFGLALPDDTRAALARAARDVHDTSPRARTTAADNLHLTLLFLGLTEPDAVAAIARTMAEVAARTAPFELTVAGAGTFGGRHPRVLWASVSGDVEAAAHLAAALAAATGTPLDRPFRGHVTLARARARGGDATLTRAAKTLQGQTFGALPGRELVLFESRSEPGGVRYLPIARRELHIRD
jgi:2'-5' RNA ligase